MLLCRVLVIRLLHNNFTWLFQRVLAKKFFILVLLIGLHNNFTGSFHRVLEWSLVVDSAQNTN